MNTTMDSTVIIQSTSQSMPSTPCWFGEVTADSRSIFDTGECFRRLKSGCASLDAGSAITM